MKIGTFEIEIITPCFCGGAEPEKRAEIRAPSIRGQLRWWFRTLGGFKSLAPMPVAQQEAAIFGSTAGDQGQAARLVVRTVARQIVANVRDGQELGHPNFSAPAFLTFPVQSREKDGQKTQYAGRGVLIEAVFDLVVLWRGQGDRWDDITALVAVFGHLGALGFRGRRAMGALAFNSNPPCRLDEALPRFSRSNSLLVKTLPASSAKNAITVLGAWLKSCRAHGRSGQNDAEQKSPYFKFAKRDHDIGYKMPATQRLPAFRPALGLPIIQRTRNGTNTWDWNWNSSRQKGEGRFASPVLLRPHRDAQGKWHALVIFVDERKWPVGKKVLLNGQSRDVSLDFYEAMKRDTNLKPFIADPTGTTLV
jgi:CRISPR/Cas system CMR-associated protein Cmr1 (group 7 of RAMP superfamily)